MKVYDNYYFIGIGGIGMSAIARFFKHAGHNVSGYDRTPSPLTAQLESEGIAIHYEDRPDLIPDDVENTFVIYTPAVPADLGEMRKAFSGGYAICKRSRALGEIARNQKCLAVAGTHGKTTTSTLLAHILTASGEGCNAFLGGISKNYDTNLLLSKNRVLVAEADEFDRSFLQLFPYIAVITATDADHLDIYSDHAHVVEAFGDFASQVSKDGALVIKQGVEVPLGKVSAKVYRYSYDTPCDFYAADITPLEGGYFDFTLVHPSGRIPHCKVGVPGWVNVENAVAASAVALLHGITGDALRGALASFSGVKRRFDIHVNTPECAYIDDYAHHPNEMCSFITAVRDIYPGKSICGVFQPHLYTRTRDFADEFAAALDLLDRVILLPIYPAREKPIEGITSEFLLSKVTVADKRVLQKPELVPFLQTHRPDVLLTIGAGDIDRFVPVFATL